jgi:hypothetical protein
VQYGECRIRDAGHKTWKMKKVKGNESRIRNEKSRLSMETCHYTGCGSERIILYNVGLQVAKHKHEEKR